MGLCLTDDGYGDSTPPAKCPHCSGSKKIPDARGEKWPCPYCAFPKATSRLEQGPPDWALIATLATRQDDPHVFRGDGSVELRDKPCFLIQKLGNCNLAVNAHQDIVVTAPYGYTLEVKNSGQVVLKYCLDASVTEEDRKGMTPPF